MHDLHRIGLDRAIAFLKSIECQFKVIDGKGNVYTNISENEVKKRRPRTYPHGLLSAHVKKHLDQIKVGQVVVIPSGDFDLDSVGRTATSIMSKVYGNGSYTSHKADHGFEILRTH
tara:strand:- start:14581 stop:14928 length:348 start_codon:yes stop_codon:yes gene_type:complete